MSQLPLDIIADLLSRLPVKPLLRFRCVSKSWCALIDSRYFIRSHLNRSIETNTNRSVIFRDMELLCSIDLDSLDDDGDDDDGAVVLEHPLKNDKKEAEDDAVELEQPLKNGKKEAEVIGSCDGLLCLFKSHKDIALWNPSTRKHHKLPETPMAFPYEGVNIVYGFGYDCVGDDYKLVRITGYSGKGDDSFESEVKVYSVKSNSWRRIQDFPYHLWYRGGNAMVVSGALHWVVTRRPGSDTEKSIVAFDLGAEEFRLVAQPDYNSSSGSNNNNKNNNLAMNAAVVLGGRLCVLCEDCRVAVDLCVDIWVMKEYGVKESWTKLFSVAQPISTIRSFTYVRPLAFSKSGGEVLLVQDFERLLWYDLKLKTMKIIETHGVDFIMETDICFGSLVPLRW